MLHDATTHQLLLRCLHHYLGSIGEAAYVLVLPRVVDLAEEGAGVTDSAGMSLVIVAFGSDHLVFVPVTQVQRHPFELLHCHTAGSL